MDVSKMKVDVCYYFNTVKKRKLLFFILDQKQAKVLRFLQERCAFLSNEVFIKALECNTIKGVDFGSTDVKIASEIYGYNKGVVDGKPKNPRKVIKMDRTTEYIAAPVSQKFMEHYQCIYLDLDLQFVKNIAFILTKPRDIQFVNCKVIITKSDK